MGGCIKFLADSFLGRFVLIGYGSIITLLGLCLLWLTASLDQGRPPHCNNPLSGDCVKPNAGQLSLLFSALLLMSIGGGGIGACSMPFGADQFDNPQNPKNQRVLQTYFNWYYVVLSISILISMTVIVYVLQKAGWSIGFGILAALMLSSTIMFFMGIKIYIMIDAKKKLIYDLIKVVAITWKNKDLDLPPLGNNENYYYDKNFKAVSPTKRLRFLNKACLIKTPNKELKSNEAKATEIELCTVQQVEELKALIKVLPIWSTGIPIAISIHQQSFHVFQANTLDRRLAGNFKIPAPSFGVFAILTLAIWIALYDRILVPIISKYTKNPRGLSYHQRMGIGLVISCIAAAIAAIVEMIRRLKAIDQGLAEHPEVLVNMSAMWLIPQNCLVGLAEAFNAIGQIEFYYSQFPKSMASIGVSLFSLGKAVGDLVAIVIVQATKNITKRGGKVSWLDNNINQGHLDYYYWMLTALCVANVFYYLLCSWAYGPCDDTKIWYETEYKNKEVEEEEKEKDIVFEKSIAA
ncbi:hypothetical protein Leryth_018500 [Lithospermum erythrorhizon]|nr:hypothetical protein Leryth_018500 [Lithospermum erythrorhizon]